MNDLTGMMEAALAGMHHRASMSADHHMYSQHTITYTTARTGLSEMGVGIPAPVVRAARKCQWCKGHRVTDACPGCGGVTP